MTRALAAALALVAAPACVLPSPSPPAEPPAPAHAARELVYFPRGACETETIELELFDRTTATWLPHPEHPRLTTDTCASLDPSALLNELRLRCLDPTGKATPSEWVTGFEVAQENPCEDNTANKSSTQVTR